jgi:hypothetical protein
MSGCGFDVQVESAAGCGFGEAIEAEGWLVAFDELTDLEASEGRVGFSRATEEQRGGQGQWQSADFEG